MDCSATAACRTKIAEEIVEGEILRGIFPIPLRFSKAVLRNMAGMEPQYFFKAWNKDCQKNGEEKMGRNFSDSARLSKAASRNLHFRERGRQNS